MILVSMYMDCDLCRKLVDCEELKWCLMTNKELCIKMLIQRGTRKQACNNCREKYNLPLFNFDKKVSIGVMRSTRAVLREIKKEQLKKHKKEIEEGKLSLYLKDITYDHIFSHLIEKAGYKHIYDEVDENKKILKSHGEW